MDSTGIRDTFRGILRALAACEVEFALIGALARGAWAEPRATTDIDVQVSVDRDSWFTLIQELDSRGFGLVQQTPSVDPSDSVPDQAFFRSSSGIRVDLLVAKTAFERSALARKIMTDVLGDRVPVVTREDLIVYKTLAGRPRDVADVVAVIEAARVAGHSIDWAYVETWCEQWQVSERLAENRALARKTAADDQSGEDS